MPSIGLQQNLTQTTKLSPTQIQVIRMLEIPSVELNQRINEELQENPALEEGADEGGNGLADEVLEDEGYMPDDGYDEGRQRDPLQNEDFNYEQYISDDETPSYMLHPTYNPADDDHREVPIIGGSSLMEELKSQVYLTDMTKSASRHAFATLLILLCPIPVILLEMIGVLRSSSAVSGETCPLPSRFRRAISLLSTPMLKMSLSRSISACAACKAAARLEP